MKKRSGFTVMHKLVGLIKPLVGYMFVAVLMGLLGHLAATFITVLGGYAIVEYLGFDAWFSYKKIFVIVVVLALVRGVLRYAEQACNHYIAFKLLALIREKVFMALRKLCPAKLEGRDKGDLISVITSDIELLEVFYAHTISPILIAAAYTWILCIFIGSYAPALGMIALAAYGMVGIWIPLMISKSSGDTGLSFRRKSGEMSSFMLESLRGLSEMIQYGQGRKRLEEITCKTEEISKDELLMKRLAGKDQAITNSMILGFDLLMLLSSAYLYTQNVVGFDGVIIPTIALMGSFGPVVALANLGSTLQNTFAAGNRVLDLLEEEPKVQEITGKEAVNYDGAKAEQVTFAYDNEVILDNLSIDIPKGKIVGIAGKSGSGKSTLLKLFMRFWETDQGAISISDKNINEINTDNLRDLEGFVTQETHLFHDSIRNNLRIAKLDATNEEMEEACKKASIHAFIMSLPEGYDTKVGELGDTLSGGERQRLGLARAFLHNGELVLLDEPTSNLDSLNEAVILKSLKEFQENKTVVLVSHRESTMRIADVRYSVEHGRMSILPAPAKWLR